MPLRRVLPHQPKVRCASCSAVCTFGYTRRLFSSSHHGPEPGTRYFRRTQVIPRDVSQSQISVPSQIHGQRLVTSAGEHPTAAPVLWPLAAYVVHCWPADIVSPGPPRASFAGTTDSGFGLGIASGTAPGQIELANGQVSAASLPPVPKSGEQKCNRKREVDGFVYSQESADGCASKQCGAEDGDGLGKWKHYSSPACGLDVEVERRTQPFSVYAALGLAAKR